MYNDRQGSGQRIADSAGGHELSIVAIAIHEELVARLDARRNLVVVGLVVTELASARAVGVRADHFARADTLGLVGLVRVVLDERREESRGRLALPLAGPGLVGVDRDLDGCRLGQQALNGPTGFRRPRSDPARMSADAPGRSTHRLSIAVRSRSAKRSRSSFGPGPSSSAWIAQTICGGGAGASGVDSG